MNISNKLSASALLTIGSYRPSNNIRDFFERSGITVGINGTIARNKIAPARTSGRLNKRLAAIFAPLEYPTAMTLSALLYQIRLMVRRLFPASQPMKFVQEHQPHSMQHVLSSEIPPRLRQNIIGISIMPVHSRIQHQV